jgi:hypothetical protein
MKWSLGTNVPGRNQGFAGAVSSLAAV